MEKRISVFVSILLFIAAVIIQILLKDSNTNLDQELIGFFSGLCMGAAVTLILITFLKSSKKPKEPNS